MLKTFTRVTYLVLLLAFSQANACTGIQLTQKDGSTVNGRTLEFGIPIDMHTAVMPRGYKFTGTTPQGKGLAYTAKYAALGIYCFKDVSLMDGINEKGLATGAFYFPGFAGYAKITSQNQSKALSPTEFTNWILTQFATLDEVKEGIKNVVIAPTVVEGWGPAAPPLHYIVYDAAGKSLVIEPINGELVATENPIGAFTNSPTFDWHMTNLRNFINLSAVNVDSKEFAGVEFYPFGQGSGMVGLPGDFTPPSRFVRAAIFSRAALPVDTSEQGVFQVFHILNQFDIPRGVAREKTPDGFAADSTEATCVKDPKTLKYYFRTYEDQTIRMVDLNKFDLNAKTIQQAQVTGDQTAVDFTANLKG